MGAYTEAYAGAKMTRLPAVVVVRPPPAWSRNVAPKSNERHNTVLPRHGAALKYGWSGCFMGKVVHAAACRYS